MPNSTEFGGEEDEAGMNIFILIQVEIVLPPFSLRTLPKFDVPQSHLGRAGTLRGRYFR